MFYHILCCGFSYPRPHHSLKAFLPQMDRDLDLARCVRSMREERRKNAFSAPGFYFVRTPNVRGNKRSMDTLEKNETVMIMF